MDNRPFRLFLISLLGILPLALLSGCATDPNHQDPNGDGLAAGRGGYHDLKRHGRYAQRKNTPKRPNAESKNPDLWQRIRGGFQLDQPAEPRIDRELEWLTANADFLERASERAEPYLYYIVSEAERRGMPLELALLPAVESGFQPHAKSAAQALGLWQFIPSTAKEKGLKQTWWYEGRRDVKASTHAALDFLQSLADMFEGDWELALAAYNAGPGAVNRAISQNEDLDLPTDFWSLDLPTETRQYVPRLLAMSRLVANPKAYGITLAPIPNQPHFAEVRVPRQIDLAIAAKLADVPKEQMLQLNPAFLRGATDPKKSSELLLPKDKAELFSAKLGNLEPTEWVNWQRYQARRGDTVLSLAHKLGVDTDELLHINGLSGTALKPGQSLLVPRTGVVHLAAVVEERPVPPAKLAPTAKKDVPGDKLANTKDSREANRRPPAPEKASAPTLKPPASVAAAAPAAKPSKPVKGNDKPAAEKTYVVRAGDTLEQIARAHGLSEKELASRNKLPVKGRLRPGQTLQVAATDSIPPGRAGGSRRSEKS